MRTIATTTGCLTYEELQTYAANDNKAEHARLYMHISSCELCSCAVNGFAVIPFIADDIVAIHREVDARTNATQASPLTLAQIFIVIASLVSIFGFYHLTDIASLNKVGSLPLKYLPSVSKPKEKREMELTENAAGHTKRAAKRIQINAHSPIKKLLPPLEKLTSIDIYMPEVSALHVTDKVPVPPAANFDVLYIYDLKVADYSHLYFKTTDKIDPHNYTPPSKENKNAEGFEDDTEQHIAAHTILKKGLGYFNKGEYSKAIEQFQLLLENNPRDVNALFYTGTALYKLNRFGSAIKYFEFALQHENTVFHPEAKWQMAQALAKTGDLEASKQYLTEIMNENGFYSSQAKELLKHN